MGTLVDQTMPCFAYGRPSGLDLGLHQRTRRPRWNDSRRGRVPGVQLGGGAQSADWPLVIKASLAFALIVEGTSRTGEAAYPKHDPTPSCSNPHSSKGAAAAAGGTATIAEPSRLLYAGATHLTLSTVAPVAAKSTHGAGRARARCRAFARGREPAV